MTIDQKKLPGYFRKEEIMNSITHFLGVIFAVIVLIIFIVLEVTHPSLKEKTWPFYIYVFTMMFMFFNSGFYHSRKLGSKSRAICRLIDHCDIYLFVAGTYTPLCLFGMENHTLAMAMIIMEWAFALIGIVLNIIDMNSKVIEIISFAIYIIGGWALVIFYPFGIGMNFNIFLFVLIGGIAYTVGAILYGIGAKKHWFHSIFHVFVLAAAILQFVGVYYTLLSII